MTESSTPASDNGAPIRMIVGSERQSGAPMRNSPRRNAMTRPSRNPPPRTMTEASAAPSTPSRGNGPSPMISSGSSRIETHTEPASIRNGVRVSPAARNVASMAKNPNTSGPPSSQVDRYAWPSVATSAGTVISRKIALARPRPVRLTTSPASSAYPTAAAAARAACSGSPSPWRRAATAISPVSTISPRLSTTQTENPAVDTAASAAGPMSRPTQMLSIRLKEKGHAIIATAGAARRKTMGRSGPVGSAPATCLAGGAGYQHERVLVALDVAGDDAGGHLLRRIGEEERLRESVLDSIGKENHGITQCQRHGARRGTRLLGADESRARYERDARRTIAEIGAQHDAADVADAEPRHRRRLRIEIREAEHHAAQSDERFVAAAYEIAERLARVTGERAHRGVGGRRGRLPVTQAVDDGPRGARADSLSE